MSFQNTRKFQGLNNNPKSSEVGSEKNTQNTEYNIRELYFQAMRLEISIVAMIWFSYPLVSTTKLSTYPNLPVV